MTGLVSLFLAVPLSVSLTSCSRFTRADAVRRATRSPEGKCIQVLYEIDIPIH